MERRVRTRTGTEIIVRPIVAADHDALIELFDHLGPESRYSRFMFPAQSLTESEVNYFTDVDHHTHEALWALSESGEPVGTARYVCLEDRPGVAEIAVTIADGWHEHGVGTALLDLHALQQGHDRPGPAARRRAGGDAAQRLADRGRGAAPRPSGGGRRRLRSRTGWMTNQIDVPSIHVEVCYQGLGEPPPGPPERVAAPR
jgi:GNAT superfamily N-acetyltransferase